MPNAPLDASGGRTRAGGASFALSVRLTRLVFLIVWTLFARFTPHQLAGWRRMILKGFGARMGPGTKVYGSARIWLPAHLSMDECAVIGPGVDVYAQAPIHLGAHALVSQRAVLCAGAHDHEDPDFPLIARPITIAAHAWIAAEAFLGPGVTVAEGAVLGARGVAMTDLEGWTVYSGNPATALRRRARIPG